MKKLTYLLIALTLLGAGVFISCDKVKDLLEVTIHDVEFTAEFNVSDYLKADGFPFAGTVTLDPTKNDSIAKYIENIRRIEVTEIKIVVDTIAPTSGVILNEATFSFTDKENSDAVAYSYTMLEAKPLVKGTKILIGGVTPDYTTISDILSTLHKAELGVDGNVNQPGLLELTFTITADITVGVPR